MKKLAGYEKHLDDAQRRAVYDYTKEESIWLKAEAARQGRKRMHQLNSLNIVGTKKWWEFWK